MSELIEFGLLGRRLHKTNEVDTWVSTFQLANSQLGPGPWISHTESPGVKMPVMGVNAQCPIGSWLKQKVPRNEHPRLSSVIFYWSYVIDRPHCTFSE